jgi:nitrogen fixation NifU-like protein
VYSDKVLDHFTNPRNAGTMPDANGIGTSGDPGCGDVVKIFVKVNGDHIDDVRFQTFGCGSAIATSSMVTELVKGKTLGEARAVTNLDVAEALDGLPENKLHCSNMAADAMHAALDDYERRKGPQTD